MPSVSHLALMKQQQSHSFYIKPFVNLHSCSDPIERPVLPDLLLLSLKLELGGCNNDKGLQVRLRSVLCFASQLSSGKG